MSGASPRCLYGCVGLSRVAHDRYSGMISSSIWEIEVIRDQEGGISFQIPGFGKSAERDGGKSNGKTGTVEM